MDNSEIPQDMLKYAETKLADLPAVTSGFEAPVIFVDLIRGAMVLNDVARVNLFQTRMDVQNNELALVQVATLALPASQLQAWGEFLLRMAKRDPDAEIELNHDEG